MLKYMSYTYHFPRIGEVTVYKEWEKKGKIKTKRSFYGIDSRKALKKYCELFDLIEEKKERLTFVGDDKKIIPSVSILNQFTISINL